MIVRECVIKFDSQVVPVSKNNPYRSKVFDFPGRLFTNDMDEDANAVRELANGKQVICEIGSGSGGHLIDLGKKHPDALIFGFELRFKRSVRTIEKALEADVQNVFVVRKRGENIPKFFDVRSLDAVYVNFPDPWAKRRTQKNRIMSEAFVSDILSLLKADGFLSFKTDHAEYFDAVISQLSSREDLEIIEESRDLHESDYSENNIITEFERLFIKQDLPIHYLKAINKT